MNKQAETPKTDDAYQNVLDALSAATGLTWSPPPKKPSVLQNGYHVETEMVRAPHLVRKLKDAAVSATGRPRAIVFERSSQKNASVNIPREIAENEAFLGALSNTKIKAAKPAAQKKVATRPAPKPGLKRFSADPLPEMPAGAIANGNSLHPQTVI